MPKPPDCATGDPADAVGALFDNTICPKAIETLLLSTFRGEDQLLVTAQSVVLVNLYGRQRSGVDGRFVDLAGEELAVAGGAAD